MPRRARIYTSGRECISLLLICVGALSAFASLFIPFFWLPVLRHPLRQPYPSGHLVTVASIDPTVISLGGGNAGDNWPSTWADDDQLYTYVADGTGFGLPVGMSMAPAVITGSPGSGRLAEHMISTNMIGMGTGNGAGGKKVSGLISQADPNSPSGHVLFAWVRNITSRGGASLMYSYDHARTWAWAWGDPSITASAIIPELGYPTWMQAGRNATASQDSYLYFYSQDASTAYQVADHVILGRVERTQGMVKRAYRYFAGLDSHSQPLWSPDISLRKPVFTAAGQCYRVFVTYHPILKQYFLLTANGDSLDSNWQAGKHSHNLGIYEAPSPWGPWLTVYNNDAFQKGMNVFAPQMVPKWIAADGKSFFLLFSSFRAGPYRFNLQKITLKPTSGPQKH